MYKYVTRRPRSTRKTVTQKKMTDYYKPSGYKRRYPRSTRPARFGGSRINYQVARAVSRAMDKVSENKIVSLTKVDEAQPVAIQTGHNVYTESFTVGNTPTSWSGTTGLVPIGGMTMPLGSIHSDRNGKYIYFQKTHLTMKIDMDSTTNFQFPCDFRVLCIKSRRANNPVGISNRYDLGLFLDTAGNEFGHATPGVLGTDMMFQPTNKKDWVILSDKKFTLSNPSVAGTTATLGYSGKYAVNKTMIFNLPYYAKTEINAATNAPADLDTNYVIVCYASMNAQDDFASKWEVSLRGSTTFKDN